MPPAAPGRPSSATMAATPHRPHHQLLMMVVMEAHVVGANSGAGRSSRQRRLPRDVGEAAATIGSATAGRNTKTVQLQCTTVSGSRRRRRVAVFGARWRGWRWRHALLRGCVGCPKTLKWAW